MAQNAPGKHYRKGISLMKLFEMFPDDETAEQWFVGSPLARGHLLSILRQQECKRQGHAQDHAVPLQ